MGSRLSRPSGAEATGVVRGRSRPEEPPRRLGPHCRLASLLRGSEKRPAGLRKSRPAAPYVRRVRWLREIQAALREQQRERAVQLLRLLRKGMASAFAETERAHVQQHRDICLPSRSTAVPLSPSTVSAFPPRASEGKEAWRTTGKATWKDLGLEGTFLNDVLYKKATFLNLVDPISHDLLMNLARDLQCPKKEYDPWKSSDRICRQLIYHLSPHSKWHRSGLRHRKSHSSLKSSLQKKLSQEAIHLSGVPLSTHDIQHLASYLQDRGDHLLTVDLSFTDLKDEEMRFLMPFLRSLPNLTHLSLNGNHLTRATVKDLTDAMKDMAKFPSLAWIDLGNNVDVSSMPQPLLVGLRKRLSQQTTLPTIYESLDCTSEASSGPETSLLEEEEVEEEEEEEDLQGEEGIPPVAKHCFHQQSCER